jgi:nitrile hydratase accessory protein
LSRPDDAFAPPGGCFAEPWHAQVLALAHAMKEAGHITPTDWAKALGAALRDAEAQGAPDTKDTYFAAALTALERLAETAGIPAEAQALRKSQWEAAYHRTPHGHPVLLDPTA